MDLKTLFQHCQAFNISTEGKREKELVGELLAVRVDRNSNSSDQTDKFLEKAIDRYNEQKDILIELLHSAKRFFGLLPPMHLPFRLTHDGLKQQIADMLPAIESPQCPILILGDVGAGKSLFINLLLQMKLLPTTARHCTPTICEIEYSTSRSLNLYPHAHSDMLHTEIPLDGKLPEECYEQLDYHLNKAKIVGTEKTSPYSRVVLKWDAPILKQGVVLVDSPGLNDGEQNLDEVVRMYVPKAIAIICVIPCITGVTESIRKVLNGAMEQENFNPAALMFVCSKIDQIPEEEKEALLGDIREALTNITNRDPDMFPLNTRVAFDMLSKFQTPALKEFTVALDQFLAESFRFKLQRNFEKLWSFNNQFGLVSRAEMEIHGRLTIAARGNAANKMRYVQIKAALGQFKRSKRANFIVLEQMATELKDNLLDAAMECITQHTEPLRVYAASVDVSHIESYKQLETCMTELLVAQVEVFLKRELQDTFNKCRRPLIRKLREIWQHLNSNLQETEELLFNMKVEIPKDEQWAHVSKLLFGLTAPVWLPIGIVLSTAMVITTGPLIGIGLGGKWVYGKIDQMIQFKKWQEDPKQWQKEFVTGFRARLLERPNLNALVSRYIDPNKLVYNLSRYFDQMVSDNERYLNSLTEERRPSGQILAECSELYDQLSPLCLLLIRFHVSRLMRYPINYYELDFVKESDLARNPRKGYRYETVIALIAQQSGGEPGFVCQTSYGRMCKAVYKKEQVAVKKLYPNYGVYNRFLRDEKNIATLRHDRIVQYYGCCAVDDNLCIVTEWMPRGLLIDVLLGTSHTVTDKKTTMPSPWSPVSSPGEPIGRPDSDQTTNMFHSEPQKSVRRTTRTGIKLSVRQRLRMAIDIAEGMDFLRKSLPGHANNYEPVSLFVTQDLRVKLGDMSLPKRPYILRSPYTKDTEYLIPRYLSPNALQHYEGTMQLISPNCPVLDTYSFGVVLYEIFTRTLAYSNARFSQSQQQQSASQDGNSRRDFLRVPFSSKNAKRAQTSRQTAASSYQSMALPEDRLDNCCHFMGYMKANGRPILDRQHLGVDTSMRTIDNCTTWEWVPESIMMLMECCWVSEASERPSFADILLTLHKILEAPPSASSSGLSTSQINTASAYLEENSASSTAEPETTHTATQDEMVVIDVK
eukprot:TRINITY_DN4494_c0_g1_i4.p1 TRINITY_DN4494_c0_g1~~TRINITY_DN4494_c0_g1_i4.p1  ORF type:complete len:1348 (+),score=238.47 TRINITY_DN4494_c0_g1_i4:579-4046(+)